MKKKVLIVDDNVALTNLYRASLSLAGYAVSVAHTGAAAVAAIEAQAPDAILLDLVLPDADGLAILKSLRAKGELTDLPVIVFSNTYSNERLQQVWEAGATQVLAKASSSPNQVVATLKAVFAASPDNARP